MSGWDYHPQATWFHSQKLAVSWTVMVSTAVIPPANILCLQTVFSTVMCELSLACVADPEKAHSARNTNRNLEEKYEDIGHVQDCMYRCCALALGLAHDSA